MHTPSDKQAVMVSSCLVTFVLATHSSGYLISILVAQMQISQAGNIRERAWLSLRLLRTFLTELAGIVTTLPYGLDPIF